MKCFNVFDAELAEVLVIGEIQNHVRNAFPRFLWVLEKNENSKHWLDEDDRKKAFAAKSWRPETSFRALFVLTWGSFEEFLRRYVQEAAAIWNACKRHGARNSKVWSQHALICAKVITDEVRGENFYKVNLDEVGRYMSAGICATGVWPLNGEALSCFVGGFSDNHLEKLGERIDVNLTWPRIGEGQDLQKASGKKGSAAVGEWTREQFCALRDKRNRFAHQGVGAGGCGIEDLASAASFLRTLAQRLVCRAEEDLRLLHEGPG